MSGKLLQGKRALVFGVANARSIAWGIANRWREEGAEVFVTYQNERFRQPVEKLVRSSWGPYDTAAGACLPAAACDVTCEEDVAALWRTLQERGFCCHPPAHEAEAGARAQSGEGEGRREGGARDGGLPVRRKSEPATAAADGDWGSLPGARDSRKTIDVILHSVAHAPTDAMRQGFVMGTTQEAFVSAHVVSAYSLVSTVRHALPFLSPGASVVALTYIGSQRPPNMSPGGFCIPLKHLAASNYNVMGPAKASLEGCARALAAELGPQQQQQQQQRRGSSLPGGGNAASCSSSSLDPAAVGPGGVRVNCLSPGPVRTMASRGIAGFDAMRQEAAARAPLGRGADLEEIAGVATFLASPLSSAVTGQTVYADCGFSAVV